jgi:hypothetical protein
MMAQFHHLKEKKIKKCINNWNAIKGNKSFKVSN